MIDKERVIKGLEYHLKELSVGKTCFECPYCGDNPCEIHLIADAIALLKEQDNCENCAVAIEDRQPVVRCRDCKHAVLTSRGEAKYCQFWQEDEDGNFGGDPLYLDSDFFCAGGERRDGDG